MGKFSMRTEIQMWTDTMVARQERLRTILARNDMELRDDSRLACDFIKNDGNVHLVAHELLCTNFLFQNTNYDKLCQEGLRQIAQNLKDQYGLPWKQTWQIAKEYGVPALKMYALAEANMVMPSYDVS